MRMYKELAHVNRSMIQTATTMPYDTTIIAFGEGGGGGGGSEKPQYQVSNFAKKGNCNEKQKK